MLNDHDKEVVHKRLRKVAGQVAGIERMVEQDRYCIDVVMQLSAARAALAKVSEVVLGRHFETCMAEAFTSGSDKERRDKIDELMKVFGRHGKS
jgi:DNA-binding FrmR family transcriptional regulator